MSTLDSFFWKPGPSSRKNEDVLRNHGFDKYPFNETTVAFNERRAGRGQVAKLLGLTGVWNSHYASVQKMLDHLHDYESGSVRSASSYCYHLGSLCRFAGRGPDELVQTTRETIEKILHDYGGSLRQREKPLSARSVNSYLRILKTFFVANGFSRENGCELRVKTQRESRTFADEYVPALQEALLMAERARSKRDRAIELTLITSGLRNTSLRAMQIGDVYEQLQSGQQILTILIRASWNLRLPEGGAAKNGIEYTTFIAPTATKAIRSMLAERETLFSSRLLETEPLFVSNYNQLPLSERRMKPLSMGELEAIIHSAARAADVPQWRKVRVHSLRKVFNAVLRSPLADGTLMDPTDQEYLMGHSIPGIRQSYYDPTKIDRLRGLYSKLVFEDRSVAQDIELKILKRIARSLDVKLETAMLEKEKELARPLIIEECQQFLRDAFKAKMELRKTEQRIVSANELDRYLGSGLWSFVASLADSRMVIRRNDTEDPDRV
jgi:integrase